MEVIIKKHIHIQWTPQTFYRLLSRRDFSSTVLFYTTRLENLVFPLREKSERQIKHSPTTAGQGRVRGQRARKTCKNFKSRCVIRRFFIPGFRTPSCSHPWPPDPSPWPPWVPIHNEVAPWRVFISGLESQWRVRRYEGNGKEAFAFKLRFFTERGKIFCALEASDRNRRRWWSRILV